MRIFHAHLLSVYGFKARAENWGPFSDSTDACPESVCARIRKKCVLFYKIYQIIPDMSCINEVAHPTIWKLPLFPNNNKIALFKKRRHFSFILSLSWFPFCFFENYLVFLARYPPECVPVSRLLCSGVFEGRVVSTCAVGVEKIQLGAHCCLKNSLPVMISVLQLNTDAQTRVHTHTNTHKHRCWEWWNDGGEGRDGCWGEMRRELLSPSTLWEERESVRERLLRDRPVKVGGWARSVEKEWLEWVFLQWRSGGSDISREAQHPCGFEKANGEKRGFWDSRESFDRETRRNGAKPITAGRSGPMIAGVYGQQGPCADRDCVGEQENHPHAFISPPLSSFCLFCLTVAGPLLLVGCHYVSLQSC